MAIFFFFSSRRRHTSSKRDWSSDVCSSDLDIAMMQLFGGFGPAVLDGYSTVFPLAAGWRDRIPVFQLVPLLVHVLLFGGGYAGATLRALEQTLEIPPSS